MTVDLPRLAIKAPPLKGWARFRAFLDMWFVDHGFIRDIYLNLHPVSEGVWRSAQPGPNHLKKIRSIGVRTILNLRGRRDNCGSYILEREACEKHGLQLIDFPIRSRDPLDRETIQAAIRIFSDIEYPVLIHCKSGADRAGFMTVLYLFTRTSQPLREIMKKHLSLAYGHLRHAKTGIIDFFYESYIAANDTNQISFQDWIDHVYDAKELSQNFRENWFYGIIVDWVLRRE